MVWINAEGNLGKGSYDFAKCTTMTAPYTTDPAVAQATARALRTEECAVSPDQIYAVGCGYGAHYAKDGLRIVRLSDGAGWFLPNLPEPDKWQFNWGRAMGMTCDEMFLTIPTYKENFVRIKLSSLGEPEPSNL